ncbi:MAG: hypothetical protein ACI841_001493 [Planctomycetota bacterium]|jgi:hypothetical protein
MSSSPLPQDAPEGARARTVFAAAHIVMTADYEQVEIAQDTLERQHQIEEHVDWEATRAIRLQLDEFGFGIAEAMDTAQRFDIGWILAQRLIEECGALDRHHAFVAGAGYDQLADVSDPAELIAAVVEQARFIRAHGGIPVILPMQWLTESGADEATYVEVYEAIANGIEGPAIVHWLGEMFLPSLRGYFPGASFREVMKRGARTFIGAKLSLFDRDLEVSLRRELRERGQVIFTGDDLNFADLILGGDPEIADRSAPAIEDWADLDGRPLALGDFSHALLGVFGAIARPVEHALDQLEAGDAAGYSETIRPCEELGRWLFQAPVPNYKAGVAFLTYLDGRQARCLLPLHAEHDRSIEFLTEATRLGLLAEVFADESAVEDRLARTSR